MFGPEQGSLFRETGVPKKASYDTEKRAAESPRGEDPPGTTRSRGKGGARELITVHQGPGLRDPRLPASVHLFISFVWAMKLIA